MIRRPGSQQSRNLEGAGSLTRTNSAGLPFDAIVSFENTAVISFIASCRKCRFTASKGSKLTTVGSARW